MSRVSHHRSGLPYPSLATPLISASSSLFSSNKKMKKPKRSHPTECRVERDGSERTESIRLIVSNRRKKSQEGVHTLEFHLSVKITAEYGAVILFIATSHRIITTSA
ncbi:hypothetical protein HZH68_006007 [Vespula germanica]|uniref:Uncharacterized protein n=1 Tax=Vespula germanica TaxID=30212 RepID=A0A834KAR4_VESGE|nr:hypothetical protein HZH68_006007 [Vespula germanica]